MHSNKSPNLIGTLYYHRNDKVLNSGIYRNAPGAPACRKHTYREHARLIEWHRN